MGTRAAALGPSCQDPIWHGELSCSQPDPGARPHLEHSILTGSPPSPVPTRPRLSASCRGKRSKTLCDFWWELIQHKHLLPQSISLVFLRVLLPFQVSHISKVTGALSQGGAGQSEPGSSAAAFPCPAPKSGVTSPRCLNPIEAISISFSSQNALGLAQASPGTDALWAVPVTLGGS